MTTHTAEPWTLGEELTNAVEILRDGKIVAMVTAEGDELTDEDRANAARIVACVNYCEGVSSIVLENSKLANVTETLRKLANVAELLRDNNDLMVAELRTQRDELAAALREVLAVSANREAFVMLGPRAFIKAENIARAVLAKLDK